MQDICILICSFRLHESEWVSKDSRLPVSRAMLMIGLQGVQQILVRASDTAGATKATIEGITLDVAKVFLESFCHVPIKKKKQSLKKKKD